MTIIITTHGPPVSFILSGRKRLKVCKDSTRTYHTMTSQYLSGEICRTRTATNTLTGGI